MITRFAFATALVVGFLGIAAAGPTITDKHYWPNEVGPGSYQKQPPVQPRQTVQSPAPSNACAYVGGSRSTVRSCR